MLSQDNPKALFVMAFYRVLLKRSEGYWYLRGHGVRLLSDICPRLILKMGVLD